EQWLGSLSLIPSGGDLTASLTVVAQPTSTGVTIRIAEMSSGAFDPGEITIPASTTVTWVNDATMAHTITGAGGEFRNSGMLDPGASFSQTFTEPGVFSYVCDPHPWMTGVITVVG
ncbi:MAG: cupredoxin domain-containing protein, partial [Thermomicrobiales bacterium]|nr:cupredoxin domain-containing protein [Thermomicrobiales bacterium]